MKEIKLPSIKICLFISLFPSLLFPQNKHYAYFFPLRNLDYDHQLLIFSLQGIVNKKGPRLFLDTKELFWQWRPSDENWMNYYAKMKGFFFEKIESFEELFNVFKSDIKGLAIYDPKIDATRYIACTYAGLEDLLPVSPDMLKEEVFLQSFPIKRNLLEQKRTNREWWEWAITNLLPLCNRKMVYSAGHSHDDVNLGGDPGIIIGLDFAVSRKMFVFNLSPADKPSSIYGTPIPGYPDDAKLFDQIMDKLDKPAGVWGWAEPEGDFAIRVSSHNNYVMCCGAPNLSFHSKAPVSKGFRFKQRNKHTILNTKLEEKYYVAFVTNEGDTPKIVAGWEAGGWLNPHRGEVAINWGVNPILVAEFPAMMEAYYSTATPKDYFFAGVSGAGYVFIDKLPDLDSFAKHTAHYLKIADEEVIDAWSTTESLPLYSRYAEIAKLLGMLRNPRGEARIIYLEDGTPLIEPDGSIFYISGGEAPKEIAERIRRVAEKHKPPFFIEVYGGVGENCPVYYKAIMDELGDKFKAVRLDEMMCAARLAGQLVVEPERVYLKQGEEEFLNLSLRNPFPSIWNCSLQIIATEGFQVYPAKINLRLNENEAKVIRVKVKADERARKRGTVFIKEKRGIFREVEIQLIRAEEIGFEDTFKELGKWEGWPGGGARIYPSVCGAVIECPKNLPFSAVEREISVDLDTYPILTISLKSCDGQWALKVRPVDDMKDVCLIEDTSQTGVLKCDVRKATGWKGKKHFKVIIFAVGSGKKVEVEWLRMMALD
ncbi:MAG: GxGYxYP domain-containing protein [bacterium]